MFKLPACGGDEFAGLLDEVCMTVFPLGLKALQDADKALCPCGGAVSTLDTALEVGLGPGISGLLKAKALGICTGGWYGSITVLH